jgi:single-strand DNA-binding protein
VEIEMAKLNKFMGIGRLGADPDRVDFRTGGHMAKFSLCVNERKKNQQTGDWEDDPIWLDCEVFNVGEKGTLADVVLDYCRKGKEVFVEGNLRMDKWEDKETGQKRSKIKVVVFNLQMLGPKDDDGEQGSRASGNRASGNRGGGSPNRGGGNGGGTGGGNRGGGSPNRGGGNGGGNRGGYGGYDDGYNDPAPGTGGGGADDDIPF